MAHNQDVHVNEQDMAGLRRNLKRAGFGRIKVWLNTPPQHRREALPKVSASRRVSLAAVPLVL